MKAFRDKVMKAIYLTCTILFLTVGTARCFFMICDDISHPESGKGWEHDPSIFLPCLAVGVPMCFLLWWREVRKFHRMRQQMQSRESTNHLNSNGRVKAEHGTIPERGIR